MHNVGKKIYLANQRDNDRCKTCNLEWDGTLLPSDMDERHTEPALPHSVYLFVENNI